jgi:hypothetical protein
MNSSIISFIMLEKVELGILLLILQLPKRKERKKGEVFLILVKTIQGWHASLTVCIQDKSAF